MPEIPAEIERPAPPILLPRGINCCRCAYELQGLAPASLCPECATPITESLRTGALIFESPRALRRLRVGAELTTWGAFAWVAVAVLGWALHAFLVMVLTAELPATVIVFLLHASAVAAILRGAWLVTTPSERPARIRGPKWVAPTARWVLIGSHIVQVVAFLVLLVRTGVGGPWGAIIFLTILSSGLGWALLLRVVAGIYDRGRLYKLARRASLASTLLIAAMGISLLAALGSLAMPALPGPLAIALGFVLAAMPFIVFILLALGLLIAFIALVELGSWIAKARARAESIRAAVGADLPFLS